MYIEYDRDQWRVCSSTGKAYQQIGIVYQTYESRVNAEFRWAPKFKPTWLVRVADMQVVRGSTVPGPYWALSYSWNQSGRLISKGGEEYDRIDNAYITYVKFEKLVQQICKDFGIQYIWYDQLCINQSDHDAKIQEIKQMHSIYGNALCTLALVPELNVDQPHCHNGPPGDFPNVRVLTKSQWCQRMWTLEEAYVSKDILFVGRNVHVWADATYIWRASVTIPGVFLPRRNLIEAKKWKACTALWYAKKRTSSKAHDQIFAFINIFPELKEFITFSYKQPLRELMIQFYRHLAQRDTSILLFGAPVPLDDSDDLPDRTSVSYRQDMMGMSYPPSRPSLQNICRPYPPSETLLTLWRTFGHDWS
ncbi:hypothetical protein BJV82DRAFT_657426 [Fennellomyces sp. T-0311]|nr:hypothetical protein BJV82DRAFT_657426 [Fennellomyces sp. T-0311]